MVIVQVIQKQWHRRFSFSDEIIHESFDFFCLF